MSSHGSLGAGPVAATPRAASAKAGTPRLGSTRGSKVSPSSGAPSSHKAAAASARASSASSKSGASAAAAGGKNSAASLNIVDRSLARQRGEVSSAAYLLLFSELVQYSRGRVTSVPDLENRLSLLGQQVGVRALEYVSARDKSFRRELKLLGALNFVVTTMWKFLFGSQADSLKKVNNAEDEYYIEENAPLINQFVAVPKDYGDLNCASFNAGIVHGILNAAGFKCVVSVFTREAPAQKGALPVTIYFIKVAKETMQRERRLAGS